MNPKRFVVFSRLVITVLFGITSQLSGAQSAEQRTAPESGVRPATNRPASATATQKTDLASSRPALEVHQGRYFRWASPRGWHFSETMNGVSLYSSNENQCVSFALLLRSVGQTTPRDFLLGMMQRIPGYGNFQVTNVKRLPDQPSSMPGTSWQVNELELQYTVNGKAVIGQWTCGVNAYYGRYDAMIVGFHAVQMEWASARLYLPEVAHSIAVTNFREVAGNHQVLLAKNNPLDNSGLLETWRQKGLSEDRISKARREGTSGYERVKDPVTGQIYEMPLESFDGALGGYRNPVRTGETLSPTQPWE
jgi:hypothetical protein